MNSLVRRALALSTALTLVMTVMAVAKESRPARGEDPAGIVLRYADALVKSRPADWAALDLGCLTLGRAQGNAEKTVKGCWDETMTRHRALVADESEKGIFGAVGRGQGFGLIADTHRQADTWKEYPPAVFLSPAVVTDTVPHVTIKSVTPARTIALQQKGKDPMAVRAAVVQVQVVYPDPLTAPLALRPEEVWWATGSVRQYAPVREVVVQFVAVSGLRKYGYPVDAAVVNETLSYTPQVPGTQYGLDPDNIGRAVGRRNHAASAPTVRGALVPGSAQWWTKDQAANRFRAGIERAKHLSSQAERLALLRRLLLIEPTDTAANLALGDELFGAFLTEGLGKSGINATDETIKHRLAELYWNIQAPTWRQELTAVSTGYEPAADALYGAIAALEVVAANGQPDREPARRLGALYRWNGDGQAAVALHERLLQDVPESERVWRGVVLVELAWDRIQWLAWNRRYDHPWIGQAKHEAEQAIELVEDPAHKLAAAQALLVLETLSLDRTPRGIQGRVQLVKQSYDRLPGVAGVWGHLIGNDLVKALVPEGALVTLPSPLRSPEVLDVSVHSTPPAQDLLRGWDFDKGSGLPKELQVAGASEGLAPWRVEVDPQAPSAPHVLVHEGRCPGTDCIHMLLTKEATFEYVDVTVKLRLGDGQQGRAGIVFAGGEGEGVYAATVNQDLSEVAIHRITEGRAVLLDKAPIKPRAGPWHTLRIQRENFAHLSRPRLAIFFDGGEVLAVSNEPVRHGGRVGLITMETATASFDGFHILKLVSNEPLSPAAAY